jgi:hypothetical protein
MRTAHSEPIVTDGCTQPLPEQMVRHYSKDVNKRWLAVNGMNRAEAGWQDTRKQLFGSTVNRLVKNS